MEGRIPPPSSSHRYFGDSNPPRKMLASISQPGISSEYPAQPATAFGVMGMLFVTDYLLSPGAPSRLEGMFSYWRQCVL